jgi:hypothetical protein
MTQFTKFSTITGEILSLYELPEEYLAAQLSTDEDAVEGFVNPEQYYINTTTLEPVAFPTSPSQYHTWNWTTHSWDAPASLTAAKEEKKNKINAQRVLLETQPILYDSKLCDADTKTISVNLPGKLKELEARELLSLPIPTGSMFWKDAENNIHAWTDATTYKEWLSGLAIAISERTTTLYGIAWTKKAIVDAMTSLEDILNYDETDFS